MESCVDGVVVMCAESEDGMFMPACHIPVAPEAPSVGVDELFP